MNNKTSTTLTITLVLALTGCASTLRTYQSQQQLDANLERQQSTDKQPTPDNKRVYLDLIRKLQEANLYFASLAHLDAYEKTNGPSPESQRLRADALRETQQATAADILYRQLLDTSEAANAWRGLGLIAGTREDYRTAVTDLRNATQRDPANATALGDLGYAQLRSGDFESARVSLGQAAELSQDNKKILGNLALLLVLTGERDKADVVMTQAKLSEAGRRAVYRMAEEIASRKTTTSALHYATADDFAMSLQQAKAPE
jgi:Flp pilus assembly protein TadD